MPTWRVHRRDGDVLDVDADWLTDRPGMLTFESVVLVVNSPRWIVVRRIPRSEVRRLDRLD